MRTRTLVLVILVGMIAAAGVELILHAASFGEELEAFDTIFAVASIGLIWLFKKEN